MFSWLFHTPFSFSLIHSPWIDFHILSPGGLRWLHFFNQLLKLEDVSRSHFLFVDPFIRWFRRFLCGRAIRACDSGGDAWTSSNKSTSGLEKLTWNSWTCQCAVHCSFSSVQLTVFGQNFVKNFSFDECLRVWCCKSYVQKDLTRSGSFSVSPVSTVRGNLGKKTRNLVHTHVMICALKDQHYGHICEEINFWSIGQQPAGVLECDLMHSFLACAISITLAFCRFTKFISMTSEKNGHFTQEMRYDEVCLKKLDVYCIFHL